MPKIVEMIGPSGSGKTSIYDALKKAWKPEYNWVTYDQIKYSNESKVARVSRKISRALQDLLSGRDKDVKQTDMIPGWKFIDHDNHTFLGDKYQDLKTVLMDLIEQHCAVGFNGSDKRFVTAYMVMWSIAHIETVKSIQNDHRFCILKQGEGLVSRIMHLNSPSFDETALSTYLASIPFPDVLFFLETDPEIILERIKNRDRSPTLHQGMSEDEILSYTISTNQYLRKAFAAAEEAGADVYKIDGSKPVDQSVLEIMKRLS